MAMSNPNTITAVIPKLIGMSVPVLRANSIMPRLVNTDISEEAKAQGNTIDVPIPPDFVVQDVSPSNHFPDPQGAVDVTVPVPLDRWKHVPFHLTDKERKEIVSNNVLPQRFQAAVKAIADEVDKYLLSLYVEFYGFYMPGGAGIPFEDEKPLDATLLRAVLNNQLAPESPRHLVLHPSTEAYALAVPAFANAEWHGDADAIILGKMNMRVGFNFWMNQNMPTHTTGNVTVPWTVSGPLLAGVSVVPLTVGGTGDYAVGDIVTFAGHTQTYVVTAQTPTVSISIRPPLVADVADTAAITQAVSHIVNLAFHPQAYAYATRPMEPPEAGLGVISRTIVDDVSGLSMRLQVRYANYVTIWSVDILYGGQVVRPELGARLGHKV